MKILSKNKQRERELMKIRCVECKCERGRHGISSCEKGLYCCDCLRWCNPFGGTSND